MRKRLCIELIIVVLLCILISIRPLFKHNFFATYNSGLGNKLCSYFYFLNINPEPYLVAEHMHDIDSTINNELLNFYKTWQWEPKKKLINYKTEVRAVWHSLYDDGSTKTDFLKFWQTIRPQIKKFYYDNIEPIDIKVPVVHFRCSDSPFNKHRQYHMTKASTIKWMAETIKERGYKDIILLCCNQHFSQDRDSCSKYIRFYSKIFNNAGINVTAQCNSILHDFAMMVYTPLLVSLNTSSLSFIAGVAKDPQDYISCNMGLEKPNGEYILQTQADWILSYDKPLLHRNVVDYNNTRDVIKKLSKNGN